MKRKSLTVVTIICERVCFVTRHSWKSQFLEGFSSHTVLVHILHVFHEFCGNMGGAIYKTSTLV